jgi:hypothetical protein
MSTAIQAKDVVLTNPLGVSSTYANDIGIAMTLTDVRLLFSEVGPDVSEVSGTAAKAVKVLKANVIIPLQMAEAVARGLLASVATHKKATEAASNAKQSSKA